MRKNGILVLFVSLLFLQCTGMKKDRPYEFSKSETLVLNKINLSDLLGVTMQIKKIDKWLFVNDFYGDSLVKVFNIQSGKLDRYLISKGKGPNELLSPLDMHFVDNNLFLLSRPLFLLNHLSLDSVLQNTDCCLKEDYQMPPKSDRCLPLSATQFIFSGLWDKRYAYLDLKSKDSLQTFGEYPDYWEAEKTISSQTKAMFHQCMFAKHPVKNLFVSCSGYILEIYSYDPLSNKLPELFFQKQLGQYQYEFTTGDVLSTELVKSSDPCVTEIACSSKSIYLVVQSKENKSNRDIMVIDWDGMPEKLLKSNKYITCLSINEEDNKGYCIVTDPEDTLVSFEL